VIRNTYLLLSMTLLFAAVIAATSLALKLPHPGTDRHAGRLLRPAVRRA
jgi:hypothetical protein